MATAYIGLGSNLGDPAGQLRVALERLSRWPSVQVVAQSAFYRSAPMGEAGQPDYCNAACRIETQLTPAQLMDALLTIEREAGRVRDGRKWASRVLDLDLLHYEGVCQNSEELTLPHPGIAQRNFVLWPLAEISPELDIPGLGPVRQLAHRLGRDGLELL